MSNIVWQGSTNIFLQDGYPEDTVDAGGITRILVYEGPWNAILATKVPINGTIPQFSDAGWIQTFKRNPMAGGKGRLTITMRKETSGAIENPTDFQPVYSVEWEEVDLPLSHNYLFRDAFYDGNGVAKTIKTPDKIAIDGTPSGSQDGDIGILNSLLEQSLSTNPKAYTAWYTWASAQFGDNAALFIKYVKRIWNGQDTFQYHAPVATIQTRSISLPPCNPCDRYMTAKPFPGCPDGYVWVRCDDRGTRTGRFGKWERCLAYRGYEMIDKETYRPA